MSRHRPLTHPHHHPAPSRRVGGAPFVEVQYESTKAVERIATAGLTIQQILEVVQNKAEELDTGAKLQAAGLKETRLQTSWLSGTGKEREVGKAAFIPRQS